MANVLTVDKVISEMRRHIIRYNVVLSGNYVQAVRGANTGEVLDLTKVTGIFAEKQYFGQKGAARGRVVNGGAGYDPQILPGADALHWLLKVFSAAGTELVAGAYPAGLSGELDLYVEFER